MIRMTQEEARRYRQIIQRAASALTDEEAVQAPMLFTRWEPTTQYAAGERLYYDGVLYSVLQAHTSQEDWMPDITPSLYAKVLIPDPTVIPDWVQPDSTSAYKRGDKVKHNGKIWESIVDNNVWQPGVYGWDETNE